MLEKLKATRFPIEIGLLLAFAFFLPNFEAPKNLLWVAYLAAWLVNRVRSRDVGGPWDGWDTLFLLWVLSAFAASLFGGLHQDDWRSPFDIVRYVSILWAVKRSGYSDRELKWVLGMLVASTVLGLAYGYWRLYSGEGKSGTLQLHSVGHVNHTAIYIAIMLGVCAAWLFAAWQRWRGGQRAVGLAVAVLVLVSLVVTASRGAVGIGLLLLLVLAFAWWPRWKAPIVFFVLTLVVIIAAAKIVGLDVIRKQQVDAEEGAVLSFRDGVWRMGIEGWRRYPWFGVGLDSYRFITPEKIKEWRTERGEDFDPTKYVHFPHGHSLFVNTLAERGIVGFGVLGAVLIAWVVALIRRRPKVGDDDLEWLLWASALSGWFVTVGVGAVNTTLHHEHAILATLLLALWLARTRKPRAS